MAPPSQILTTPQPISSSLKQEQTHVECDQAQQLLASLPKAKGWRSAYIYLYKGFWCPPNQLHPVISFQHHFHARDTDIILVTKPKSGTTWLKALAFATVNRTSYSSISPHHPLLTTNPHDLVPFFEYKLYANNQLPDDLSNLPSPRLFATHIPYDSLPKSIKSSKCKIVYLCRNPGDTFISTWHFFLGSKLETLEPFTFDQAFDSFCKGVSAFGPFWNHILGYWKASLENRDKVLFLKYEELKVDIKTQLKSLAEFLGCPFSLEEEREGVVEDIIKLCSFENLKNLEVNKVGNSIGNFENKTLFRKGEVGDSEKYLSPQMLGRLNKAVEINFHGSGLTFWCMFVLFVLSMLLCLMLGYWSGSCSSVTI